MSTQIQNDAKVKFIYDGARTPETNTSNIAVVTLLDEFSISITKTALICGYVTGENVTYQVVIKNTGSGVLNNVVISDDLGCGDCLTYLDCSSTLFKNGILSVITPSSTSPLKFTLTGTLAPDEVVLLTYVASVSNLAECSTSITNTVTVTAHGGSCPGVTVTDNDCETITAQTYANVIISKVASNTELIPGETFNYMITLSNLGNLEANIQAVTDTLPATFNISSITLTMLGITTTLSSSDYTYNSGTHLLTIPSSSGPDIIVPPATSSGPGVTFLTITGFFS